MAVSIFVAAVVLLITGAGLATLAMVVVGIHSIDRPGHRLTDNARSPIDAVTRRVVGVGVRTPANDREKQD